MGSFRRPLTLVLSTGLATLALCGAATAQFLVPSPQLWNQSHFPGDSPEAGDWFGDVLASGDFNGDGYDDLAVGVPNETYLGIPSNGVVHVAYGTANGLGTAGAHSLRHTLENGLPSLEASGFGRALASGDFNHDGYDDLAVGAPFDDLTLDPGTGLTFFLDAGSVEVIYGTPTGLAAGARDHFYQGRGVIDEMIGGSPNDHEHFGAALASGDINGDGPAELIVGVPQDRNESGVSTGGLVHIFRGQHEGLSIHGGLINQSLLAALDPGLSVDLAGAFGAALAVGNFNGDFFTEIVVGEPEHTLVLIDSVVPRAGRVHVIALDPFALESSLELSQASTVALGGPEANARFGEVLATGDLNRDLRDDLVVGVYRADINTLKGTIGDAGEINVFYGSSLGLTTAGVSAISQNSTNVPSSSSLNETFGFGLAVADLSGDRYAETLVGVPREYFGVGAFHRFAGGAAGLLTSGSTITASSSTPVPIPSGRFGHSLATGDFDGNGLADVACGAPMSVANGISAAGNVRVTYSAPPDVIGFFP